MPNLPNAAALPAKPEAGCSRCYLQEIISQPHARRALSQQFSSGQYAIRLWQF
jgi:hypothetical protein